MSTMLRSSGKNVLVWVLLAMIVLGLGGYNVTSFSGGEQSIGAVGDSKITVKDYSRALQQDMNAAASQLGHPLGMAEAQAIGLDRAVQARLFGAAALSDQAARLKLSVGDAEVSRQIKGARPFQGTDGQFDRTAYREALRQQGLTETEFETRLRADIARSILQGAVAGGVPGPAVLVDAFAAYLGETRDIVQAEITDASVEAALPTPDEAGLQAYYTAHIADFTRPETREISYVWLTPEMLKDQVTLDEAVLRATYESRAAEYIQPDRRAVAKLVFPTAAEAAAARALIDSGKATLADLAKERGLSGADIDLGATTRDEIGGAAGDAVFARAEPGLIGPLDTDLGPALFSVGALEPGDTTTFEEAKPDLQAELAMERARRLVGDKVADLEDRLASGATLEEMVTETGMQAGKISLAPDTRDGIAAYESFREAAAKVTAEDFPELGNLEDGGVFALRLDGITAAAPIPFAQVRDKVVDSWRSAELVKAKQARATAVIAALAQGTDLAAQGLTAVPTAALARGGFVEGAPQALAETAFATAPGTAAMVTEGTRVVIVAVQAVHAADPADPEITQLRDTLGNRLGQMIGTDLVEFYARAAQDEAGIKLDSAVIAAVQARMQ